LIYFSRITIYLNFKSAETALNIGMSTLYCEYINFPLRQSGKRAMETGPSHKAVWNLAFDPKVQVSKDVPNLRGKERPLRFTFMVHFPDWLRLDSIQLPIT